MSSTLRQRLPIEVVPSSKRSPSVSSDDSTDSVMEVYESKLPTFTPPTFTTKDLLGAIPPHCFERSALISFGYVARDFAMIALNVWAASKIDPAFGDNGTVLQGWAGFAAKWACWALYWTFCGFNFVGVWIMAHECGHQAFSASKTINNISGLFLHSFVLVPYHSWRISHSKHHAATGHVSRDEVFVPAERKWAIKRSGKKQPTKVVRDGMTFDELLEDAPLYRLYWLLVQQLLGWPAYLFINASGQDFYPAWTNHFDPNSLIFDARHRTDVLLSDAGLIVMVAGLTLFANQFGFAALVKYYGIPYLCVNHWLVMITYLQHTDPNLPHYRASEWTFARGALSTIDRTMLGPVGGFFMHGICETHVLHHICSRIPHHHAWEATDALKVYLGEHYTSTDENMFVSLWKNWRACRFVDEADDVAFYRDATGRRLRTVTMPDVPSDSGVDVL